MQRRSGKFTSTLDSRLLENLQFDVEVEDSYQNGPGVYEAAIGGNVTLLKRQSALQTATEILETARNHPRLAKWNESCRARAIRINRCTDLEDETSHRTPEMSDVFVGIWENLCAYLPG